MIRRLRLWSGLIMFAFVVTHLLNHALGVLSLGSAEAGRVVFLAVWGNPVGNLVLGASFITHIALVLLALYQARHLRLPRWELARLGLGLVMPFMLIPHIFGTKVLSAYYGFDTTYAYVVSGMWVVT